MKYCKVLVLLSAVLVISPLAMSQNKEAEVAWSRIKSNPEYVYGEGVGGTVKEADNNALHDLQSKISLHLESVFDTEDTEINRNGSLDSRSVVNMLVKTYTAGTLTNTEKFLISDQPDAKVGRYIKRTEIARIFEYRKSRITEMLDIASSAESKGRIDIALRNYYWAYILARSLQHPAAMMYTNKADNVAHTVISWVPEHMNIILDDIRVRVLRRRGDDVDLFFTYKGKPVSSLDFTYQDGRDWTSIASVQDGLATLELAAGFHTSSYKIAIEFMYEEEAIIDSDIRNTISVIKAPNNLQRQSYIAVPSEDSPQELPIAEPAAVTDAGETYLATNTFSTLDHNGYKMPDQTADSAKYKRIVNQIVSAMRSGNTYSVETLFTEHGKAAFDVLIKYGEASVIATPPLQYYRFLDQTIVRGVKMQFKFSASGLRKSFVEDIVFTFNAAGKIDNLTFGLDKTAQDDILGNDAWNDTTRYAIMQFLENYKTAFAMKDIDYIQGVFDKDATIITGYVTKRAVNTSPDNGGITMKVDNIAYQTYTKDEYIKKLAKSFASKEFINIRFSSNEVIKLGKGGESYAIQIMQDYYSSNYGDKGFLMLIVDANDPSAPIIKLRTWQPEPDPEFGYYGLWMIKG